MAQIPLKAFTSDDHAPFLWQAGEQAALLVHGFPGTPAEMRPLAQVLHAEEWTVQGLLLPGFGTQIEQMHSFTAHDWVDATVDAIRSLRSRHHTVLLVGYSMGGAVAISAAVQEAVDGLILVAPFWRMSNPWQHRLWPVLRLFFSTIRPFKDVNFADPATRENITHFLPGADLDDPAVQAALRQLEIPRSILDEVRRIGQMAYGSASRLTTPGLVVQGTADKIVPQPYTRKLADQLGAPFVYCEIVGDHELVKAGNGSFAAMRDAVVAYTSSLDLSQRTA